MLSVLLIFLLLFYEIIKLKKNYDFCNELDHFFFPAFLAAFLPLSSPSSPAPAAAASAFYAPFFFNASIASAMAFGSSFKLMWHFPQ